ncbi:DUF6701 domain-containing protein [Chitinolyticbacter meiyuanensis]|uniref:DUF6701 domain-containing protein n=1 Tax=Chitinolyticbacter meiyuanensis TaxID=682798 RepID=UPI0011E58A37|nr:DUF6701 domain-containing protein [Chitinolyticbacter meiyuanensis]
MSVSRRLLALVCAVLVLLYSADAARAAITQVAASVAQQLVPTNSTLTIPVPAGTVAGDVLLAQVTGSANPLIITPPAGWTLIRSNSQNLLAAGITQALYYRVATGSEPASYTFTLSVAAWVAGSMITFRGVNTTTPVLGHAGQGGVLLLATAPAVAGCPAGAMQVGFFGFNTGALGLTIGAGQTPYATTTTNALLGVTILNGGVILGSAGSCTAVTTLAVNVTANVAQQVVLNPSPVPAPTIHHFEMNPPTTGITCKAQSITIKACMDAACSSVYNGAVTATLAPAAGWRTGAVQVLASGSGVVPFQPLTAGTYTLSVTASTPALASGGGTTCPTGGDGTCTIRVYDTALAFSTPNLVAALNSPTITVSALGTDPQTKQCIPEFASVTRAVSFWTSYTNPASGTRALTLIANPAGSATSTVLATSSPGTAVSLAFNASGQAQIQLNYPDVGQLALNAAYTGTLANNDVGLSMTGSSSFITKPYTLVLSNIRRTSDASAPPANPTTASSPLFARAGESLTMTVTAQNALGAATPNYGRETPAHRAVLISSLVAPAGGSNALAQPAAGVSQFGGYFANGSYSSGATTLTDLVWNEVGILRLTPHVASASGLGYLGLGDLGSGDGSVLTASANIGRFAPHRFMLSSPGLVNRQALGCSPASPFTYLGEAMRLQGQLTAVAVGGTTTTNYDSALGFAKLGSASALGIAAANVNGGTITPLSARLTTGGAAPSWSGGTTTLLQTATVARTSAPDGPFLNARLGIAPTDSDATALAASALNLDAQNSGSASHASLGTTQLRAGRLKLSNALGSDQLDLPVPAQLEAWNNGFTRNTLDNCTPVVPAGIGVATFGNYLGGLNSSNLGASRLQFGTPPQLASQGRVGVTVTRPGTAVRGSADLTFDLDANGYGYLKGYVAGGNYTATLQPWARVTFGGYDLKQPLIFIRENY